MANSRCSMNISCLVGWLLNSWRRRARPLTHSLSAENCDWRQSKPFPPPPPPPPPPPFGPPLFKKKRRKAKTAETFFFLIFVFGFHRSARIVFFASRSVFFFSIHSLVVCNRFATTTTKWIQSRNSFFVSSPHVVLYASDFYDYETHTHSHTHTHTTIVNVNEGT